jgi:hypothetical protein
MTNASVDDSTSSGRRWSPACAKARRALRRRACEARLDNQQVSQFWTVLRVLLIRMRMRMVITEGAQLVDQGQFHLQYHYSVIKGKSCA